MKALSLKIELQITDSVLCVRLDGELDHHTAQLMRTEVENALNNHTLNHIILNLDQLTFMDSSGIGVILGRYKQIRERGDMILCHVPPSISRLFEMSGLYKIIQVVDTEEAALEKLGVELA